MTKRQLIEFIEQIPVPDDSLLNVSINSEDIDTIESVGFSTPDDAVTDVFCIDFILKDYSSNAGCDCCGTNDREEGSILCKECADELTRRDEKNGLYGDK